MRSEKASGLQWKLCRISKGLTQQELARMVGVSEHLISKFETGRRIPDEVLRRDIMKVLAHTAEPSSGERGHHG